MTSYDPYVTERLNLRSPQPGDRSGYRALLVHPAIGRWLGPRPLHPFEAAEGDIWLTEDSQH